jgi:hypothetical protein
MIRRRARAADPERREWPPDALALFAEYAPMRQVHAPPECNSGTVCWVRDGPPSITTGSGVNRSGSRKTTCLGCGGSPKPPIVVPKRARRAKC